jgi:hypothetical protein
VLTAFIDDSGSGGDSPCYVLAGLLSTVEKWAEFSVDWDAAIHSRPNIDYFKMSEAESLKGQFTAFNSEQRDAKVHTLADLINKHVLFDYSVLIGQRAFDDILGPVLPKKLKNPYLFAFPGMMAAMASYEHHYGRGDVVECVFDKQQKLSTRAGRLYDQLRGLPGFEHSDLVQTPIRFEDDKEFLPLQGADLLAWHVRRRYCIREPARPIYQKLRSIRNRSGRFIVKADRLRQMADIMQKSKDDILRLLRGLPEQPDRF